MLERYLRGYAKGVRRYVADKPFALQVAASFLKSDDQAANNDAYELEKGLMEVDLDLPLSAVQGTLDLIKGDEPRAADARPEDFVDFRLQRKLKESGFFDRLTTEIPAR